MILVHCPREAARPRRWQASWFFLPVFWHISTASLFLQIDQRKFVVSSGKNFDVLLLVWNKKFFDILHFYLAEISPLDYIFGAMDCKIRKMMESEIETQYILKYMHTTQIRSWGKQGFFKCHLVLHSKGLVVPDVVMNGVIICRELQGPSYLPNRENRWERQNIQAAVGKPSPFISRHERRQPCEHNDPRIIALTCGFVSENWRPIWTSMFQQLIFSDRFVKLFRFCSCFCLQKGNSLSWWCPSLCQQRIFVKRLHIWVPPPSRQHKKITWPRKRPPPVFFLHGRAELRTFDARTGWTFSCAYWPVREPSPHCCPLKWSDAICSELQGIYFADKFSKSVQYCWSFDEGRPMFMLVCEASLFFAKSTEQSFLRLQYFGSSLALFQVGSHLSRFLIKFCFDSGRLGQDSKTLCEQWGRSRDKSCLQQSAGRGLWNPWAMQKCHLAHRFVDTCVETTK